MRIALYSHDTMGLGHTRRNLLIASVLAQNLKDANILLIAGAHTINQFTLPKNTDCVTLPALYKNDNGSYQAKSLNLSTTEILALRSQMINTALQYFQPDLFIVDKVPRGALGELEPSLARLCVESTTRCVLGVRDILDDPEVVRSEWLSRDNLKAIEQYYDEIWIYGDPEVYDLAKDCDFPEALTRKISYVGYLNPLASRRRCTTANGHTLCLLGGGQDGTALAHAFAEATALTGEQGLLVAGPYLPSPQLDALRAKVKEHSKLDIINFTADPDALLRGAKRVVAMGGYNTVMELLSARVPALIVPRVIPRSEQLMRAQRLSQLGLIEYLHPADLTPERLAQWLMQPISPVQRALRMEGAHNVIRSVTRLLQAPRPVPPLLLSGAHYAAVNP